MAVGGLVATAVAQAALGLPEAVLVVKAARVAREAAGMLAAERVAATDSARHSRCN